MSALPDPRRSRRRKIIATIIVAGVLVLAALGGGVWFTVREVVAAAKGTPDTTPVAAGASQPAATDRRAFYTFGHTAQTVALPIGAPALVDQRLPFIPSVTASRYRIVVRNLDYRSDKVVSNPVRVQSVYIGRDADGKGSFAAGTVARLSNGGALVDGKALVTDWYDAGTLPLSAGSAYLLGVSFSSPLGTQVGVSPAVAWVKTGTPNGAMTDPANKGEFVRSGAYLDISIEYSFEDPAHAVPVVAVFGHSLNSGANGNPKVPHQGETSAWHQVWARKNGGAASSLAVPGAWSSNFLPDSPKWQLAKDVDADYVVLWASSSDLVAGTSVDDVGVVWVSIIDKARAVWPNAKIIAFTEPPRGASGSGEAARNTWNDFLRAGPSQAACVVDVDAAVKDPANPHVIAPQYNGDDSHFSPAGHEEIAGLFQSALEKLQAGQSCAP